MIVVTCCILCGTIKFFSPQVLQGNSLDKLCHVRSVAYSVELVLLKKQQIWRGRAYSDCYRPLN